MRLSENMRCDSHASRGDGMMRLSENMRCDSHASRGDSMIRLSENMRCDSHASRGDSMIRLSENMRCGSHASRGDSMIRLSENMRCCSHASRGNNMVKLGETVEQSSMCSHDLEDRDPLECEIENGPSCRYDPTNNLQDATITLNTNYNATNFHYLLFLCCQTPEQDLLLHWTLALFEHLVKL